MPEKNTEKENPLGKKQNEPLSSENIPNAHAAGDGASGRSKEAIAEEDIQPQKEQDKNQDDASPNY